MEGMDASSLGLSLAGGALIGLAAVTLLLFEGRIAGVSGIVAGVISPRTKQSGWRIAFLAGLAVGGLVAFSIAPGAFGAPLLRTPALLLAGGVLVGLGTRVGGGCTSGHGVCGIGRLSRRSIVATLTFMATGAATVLATRLIGGVA